MSLNFVSTSVLSSTDGVSHNTETQLQPTSSASHPTDRKPLYEQLRENAEKEQEKYDEVTKAMRGTTTLDEEDIAFIQGVEDRKAEMKNDVRRKEEEEIQMFRAARLEKSMIKSEVVADEIDGVDDDNKKKGPRSYDVTRKESSLPETNSVGGQSSSTLINMKPLIVKKRRRKTAQTEENTQKASKQLKESNGETVAVVEEEKKIEASTVKNAEIKEESGLSGLLAYGSDSDSD